MGKTTRRLDTRSAIPASTKTSAGARCGTSSSIRSGTSTCPTGRRTSLFHREPEERPGTPGSRLKARPTPVVFERLLDDRETKSTTPGLRREEGLEYATLDLGVDPG